MADFNIRCPKNYPKICDLSILEREKLERPEKYKAFLMYQFNRQDDYLSETVKEVFKSPTCYVFEAGPEGEATLGVKICKICRLTLAADFGIAALTPSNLNVMLEVGMMLSLGKPILYLFSPDQLRTEEKNELPFDLSQDICGVYSNQLELKKELEKYQKVIIDKVELYAPFEKKFREWVQDKIKKFTPIEKEILRVTLFHKGEVSLEMLSAGLNALTDPKRMKEVAEGIEVLRYNHGLFNCLREDYRPVSGVGQSYANVWYKLNEGYRPILEELLFREKTKENA